MNILITGANGQLGRDCQQVLGATHSLCPVDLPDIDIAEPCSVRGWFERFRPDCVVNCAAYTRVDDAESNAALCERVNALGPAVLADACREAGAKLVHISTDYVFDGTRPVPNPYVETDTPNPQSVYGRTKLAGEAPVLALPEGAVLRTAWLYGASGANFPRTMLRLALRNPPAPLRVVADQFGSPTWSGRLARQIARLLEDFHPGLYHATAQGYCSWHDVAVRFLRACGLDAEPAAISTADYPTPARRPSNSILDNHALRERGLDVMIPWQEDIDAFAKQVAPAWIQETTHA
ncbi:MAG: dTDP-4-dehydrorhamnose reductase [Kiritimatiellia bacterium]